MVRPEMDYISNERVLTRLPRTDFFGSTVSLTKEKTRRGGEHMSESLCTCILMDLTVLKCLERGYIYIWLYILIYIFSCLDP